MYDNAHDEFMQISETVGLFLNAVCSILDNTADKYAAEDGVTFGEYKVSIAEIRAIQAGLTVFYGCLLHNKTDVECAREALRYHAYCMTHPDELTITGVLKDSGVTIDD